MHDGKRLAYCQALAHVMIIGYSGSLAVLGEKCSLGSGIQVDFRLPTITSKQDSID
jgi:hypothetical protein